MRSSEAPTTVAVIVVAAGSGTRLGAGIPKVFAPIGDAPMLRRALDPIRRIRDAVQVIVVAPPGHLASAEAIVQSVFPDSAIVVEGASTRQGSVARGLARLQDRIEVVLVHDAARALTPSAQFDRVIDAVRAGGRGVVPALPVADTIKRIGSNDEILDTVDRSELAAVQTPQGFPCADLLGAYAEADQEHTDDAALLARHGHPAVIIAGDARAFKITTPADLERAEQLLAAPPIPRVGFGSDTHAFDAATALTLALIDWPGEPGLAGHSDGDAVAHAIVDALLSAAGQGDIGSVFGLDDPRLEGAAGDVFLSEARSIVEDAGYRIGNVAVQIVGNRPRFAARRHEAEHALSAVLGAPVSVSATTTDGLGATGRGEGITALATALVMPVTRPGIPSGAG